MNQIILDFLAKNWSAENSEKIILAPVPKNAQGDLALNVFQLTKILKKSPPEILKEIQEFLEKSDFLEKTEISGPYLNLFFSSEKFFEAVFKTEISSESLKGKSVIMEFSSPNTNKPLHLGHMRNHALGISVSNLLEANGVDVHRVNIINDKGLALAKCMLSYDTFANGETPESTGEKSDHFVGRYYVQYETESKKNPQLADQLPEIMRQWEAGDEKWVGIWNKITKWVIDGLDRSYKRQGVWFDLATRESDIYEYGRDLAFKGLENGSFQKREDGAIIIDLTEKDLGEKVVLRADGTSIYLTQDLSLWPIRKEKFGDNIDEMIHVVGDEQNYYFKTVFEALKKLNPDEKTKFTHLGYGLVNLPDGRMKSREGTVVDADDLMDELHDIAAEKIKENNSMTNGEAVDKWSDEEIFKTAEQIQDAAWKFYLLRTSPVKSITFDKQKSIDFQGATGPYLQYAGVRIKSILKQTTPNLPLSREALSALSDKEKPLGIKILEWKNVLNRAGKEKNPTFIVTYLLELAQSWSSFYAENSVLKAETEELKNARIKLAQKVLDILEKGMHVLGIEIPEKM